MGSSSHRHLAAVPDDPGAVGAAAASRDSRRRPRPNLAPHAARAAHRTKRTSVALLFFPVFAVYVVLDAMRDLRDRLRSARVEGIEQLPPFRRPSTMPAPADRSMDDIVDALAAFPFRPQITNPSIAFFKDHGPDAIGALLASNPQMSTIPHLYPKPFEQRLFTGFDGVQLSGMQAMHDQPGPALVICHGMLMSKHFDAIIQIARRAFAWGFHVVTIDLRGWGQSAWTTDAPASGGYYEGRDIVEVCRELHRDPRVTSVGALGYSLGGASVLNAAHVSSLSDDRPLDGGALVVGAPTQIGEALRHISTKPHWRDPFFGLWHVFGAAIRSAVRRRDYPRELRTWIELAEYVSAPYYGVTLEEYADRASAVNFVHEIDQPVLHLHSADDFLVPVQHAEALRQAAADNPWVHVDVREVGSHVAFAAVDPSWYHSTVRRWFEYWATSAGAGRRTETPESIVGA